MNKSGREKPITKEPKNPVLTFRRVVWISAFFAAFYFIFLWIVQDEGLKRLICDLYFPIQKFLVAAVLLYAARKAADRKSKQAGSLYFWMAAFISYGIGDLIWFHYEIVLQQEPFPSPADFFYLLFYPLMWIGLANYAQAEPEGGERKIPLLDNLIVVIGSGLVMWTLTIAPTVSSDASDLLAYGISILYPVLGMMFLWGVFIYFRNRIQMSAHVPALMVGLGMIGEIASDTLYAIHYETYSSGSWIDLGWAVGSLFIAIAAMLHVDDFYISQDNPRLAEVEKLLNRLQSWPIYLPYLWVGLAYAILVDSLSSQSDSFYLVVGIGLVIGLVLVRQILTLAENRRLFQQAQHEILERKQAQAVLHEANLALDERVRERTEKILEANHRLSEANAVLEFEIGERKLAEEKLRKRAENEELIASISARFIDLPEDEIDREIVRSLGRIGEAIGADRSYISLSAGQRGLPTHYEWRSDRAGPRADAAADTIDRELLLVEGTPAAPGDHPD